MLHIISCSPLDAAVLERVRVGDSVIFIENAVLTVLQQGIMRERLTELMKTTHCYVLAPDLEVRGIEGQIVVPGIKIIDYAGFVELTVDNPVIHSWR